MISLLAVLQKSYATGWLVAAPIGPVNLEIIRHGLRFLWRGLAVEHWGTVWLSS